MYINFNNYIKAKFFSIEYTGEIILFSVDESVITEFIENENIELSEFQELISRELRSSWYLQSCCETQCFGICALQIYIAHQMCDDDEFKSGQYNLRLEQFLNIDTNRLQKLYLESQNDLWNNLKSFCNNNNFIINIPFPSSGKGCYIQYPFSQTLLNKEDLKKAPILFERVGIKINEYLPFDEFSRMIEYADNSFCMSNHYYKVKQKLLVDFASYNQLHQQLYSYFTNEWDGSYLDATKNKCKATDKDLTKETLTFVLSCDLETISVLDAEYDHIDSISTNNNAVFQQLNNLQKLYDDDFLIFEKDNISEESNYVRKFEIGKQYVLLCKKYRDASKYISSLTKVETIINAHYDIFISGILSKKSAHHFWEKYFSSQSRNYKIGGGLKLKYKTWMCGCGPQIILEENSTAWLNGKIIMTCEFDCSQLPIGSYRLKVDGFPPERFDIIEPKYNVPNNWNGWKIEKRRYLWEQNCDNPNLVGLSNNFRLTADPTSTRSWINSITECKNNTVSTNQVIKANLRRTNKKI